MMTLNHPAENRPAPDQETRRVAVPIFGLSLGGCGADQVERSLGSVTGVLEAYVNRADDTAYITYEPAHVGPAGLRRGIAATGLRAASPETWRSLR